MRRGSESKGKVSCIYLVSSRSNVRCREFKDGKKVPIDGNKIGATNNMANSIRRKDRDAEANTKRKVEIVAQKLELFDQENIPHKPLLLLEFGERRERAAEVIERKGWGTIRDKLVQAGVGENSLPLISPTGSPVI
jgi:hypothetical protein